MEKGAFKTAMPVLLLSLSLSGCFGSKDEVIISGGESEIRIIAPKGYDSLSVATSHCKSFKKSAIFNGRGEGRGGITVTNFKCALR